VSSTQCVSDRCRRTTADREARKAVLGRDRLSSFITGLMVSAMNPVRERFGRYDYARHTFIFAAPLEQRSRTDVAKS
jgi:hypothetical protein